jgi:hypothetical protein
MCNINDPMYYMYDSSQARYHSQCICCHINFKLSSGINAFLNILDRRHLLQHIRHNPDDDLLD